MQAKSKQALPLAQKALAVVTLNFGAYHLNTAAKGSITLSELYPAMDSYFQVEPLFRRTLAIKDKMQGMTIHL